MSSSQAPQRCAPQAFRARLREKGCLAANERKVIFKVHL